MPNTKATGVAYSDPQFDSVTVTGASSLQAVTATTISATAVTATSITNSGPTTGAVRLPVASVAATGNSQGTAAALSEGINVVTAADDTKGVVLPTAVAGMVVIVKNTVSAKTLKVYPATGAAINAVAANGSYNLGSVLSTLLVASSTTQWYSVPLVAS